MKALFVAMNSTIGGAERVLLDIVQGCDRRLIEPIVALRGPGPLAGALRAIDVQTFVCAAPWWLPFDTEQHPGYCFRRYWESAPAFVTPLADVIRREKVAVVYSAGTPILHGALAAHVSRTPHLQHMQDLLGRPGVAYHLPLGRAAVAYRIAGRLSSLTVCVGQTMREDIGDAIPAAKCRVIPLGFAAAPGTPGRIRLGPGDCRVGIVGRVERLKGAELLPDIVRRVCAQVPNTHFYWAGDGPADLIASLREASRVAGVPHLHFVGYVDPVADFMAEIDLLLHPSRNDTFPRVLVEAALARRPIVVTRCGGGQEFVNQNGTVGLLTDVDDSEALAASIVHLVRNPQERARLAAAAHSRAQEYDLGRFQRGMQQAIVDAVQLGPAIKNPVLSRVVSAALYAPGRVSPPLRKFRSVMSRGGATTLPLAPGDTRELTR